MSHRACSLMLAALVGAVFAPLLLHPGFLLYPRDGQATDLTITHWPAVAYNARSLQEQGQIPLWRTTVASGGPWAANPQSWLFYPAAWLFFFLPTNLTFNLLLLAHAALLAAATYSLGRQALGLQPAGAALAGLAAVLTPWISAQLAAGHVNIVLALSWLPVALLGAHRAARTGGFWSAALAGAAWSAALLNHAQVAAFVAVLTVAWFLLAVASGDGSERWGRRAAQVVVMLAVALLLCAVLLLPLAEAWPYLNRGALTLEEAGVFSLSWPQLLTALIPTYGGEPEQAIYLGLPLALLAVAGLALKRDGWSWFLALAAVVAALFALGSHGPLFPLLFRVVPGLAWLRVPSRAWLVTTFCLALLAGRGLDALLVPDLGPTLRRRVTMVSLVALATGLALAVGLALLYWPLPPAVWVLAASTVLAAGLLLLRGNARLRPEPFALGILLLVTIELGLARLAWTDMRSPEEAFAWGAEAARFVAGQPGTFRTYSPSYSLPQHTALAHDIYLADGVDPFQMAHYASFLALAGGYQTEGYSPTLPPRLDNLDGQPDAARLGLLNVGYVASEFPLEAEGLILQGQPGGTYVYQNREVLPRAFVLNQGTVSEDGDVSLEWPIGAQAARVVAYSPNRIVVEAEMAGRGLLVLSEVWYPGWRARIDGAEAPILRVEGVVRGVYLEDGLHTVEFRYNPRTFWIGLAVSAGAVLALLACGTIRLRRQP